MEKIIFGTIYVSIWNEETTGIISNVYHDLHGLFTVCGAQNYKIQVGGDFNGHLGAYVGDTHSVTNMNDSYLFSLNKVCNLIIYYNYTHHKQYKFNIKSSI